MNKNKNKAIVASVIFLAFFVFWIVVAVKGLQGNTNTANLFSALYGIMALYGGVMGLKASRHWGGYKSLVGRSIIYISFGLLAQEVGQVIYSMYTYLFHQNIPYPSLGDIGYFGSVILYILGAYTLVKALSTQSALRSHLNKFSVALVPVVLLTVSYFFFLRGYNFNWHHPLTIFLDFGYPLGQAFYISLGLIVFILSKRYLGGVMKSVVLFLIFALILQYAADFTFLYQDSRGTWRTAGFNELMYLVSYFAMTLSLLKFGIALDKLRTNAPKVEG